MQLYTYSAASGEGELELFRSYRTEHSLGPIGIPYCFRRRAGPGRPPDGSFPHQRLEDGFAVW
jgi:hypothetical protein